MLECCWYSFQSSWPFFMDGITLFLLHLLVPTSQSAFKRCDKWDNNGKRQKFVERCKKQTNSGNGWTSKWKHVATAYSEIQLIIKHNWYNHLFICMTFTSKKGSNWISLEFSVWRLKSITWSNLQIFSQFEASQQRILLFLSGCKNLLKSLQSLIRTQTN